MKLTSETVKKYLEYLREEEKSEATITKYAAALCRFSEFIGNSELTKDAAAKFKDQLSEQGFAPVTVNAELAAVNGLFSFLNLESFRLKYLKVQKRLFRDTSKELNKTEYERLVRTALMQGKERLALIMETICATGIRVSEIRSVTLEAVKAGKAEIRLKGKIRTILFPKQLRKKLIAYAKKNKTASGEIFLTRNGNSLSRGQIWSEMKRLCKDARVSPSKVFPHNLRHLFATVFYKATRDIAKLADVLGHSSIETTRIYLMTSGSEHLKQLDRLGLVL